MRPSFIRSSIASFVFTVNRFHFGNNLSHRTLVWLPAASSSPASLPRKSALLRKAHSDSNGLEGRTMSITENDCIEESDFQLFGKFKISRDQIFYSASNNLTKAFVNLRPIVPGHVLVIPARVVPRMEDLTEEEYIDLWKGVREVQRMIESVYGASSSNVAVQDGRSAGQSVPHVHVHILPRKDGDFERNDDMYDALQEWAPRDELQQKISLDVPEDDDRRDRTVVEMAEEATLYRNALALKLK